MITDQQRKDMSEGLGIDLAKNQDMDDILYRIYLLVELLTEKVGLSGRNFRIDLNSHEKLKNSKKQ